MPSIIGAPNFYVKAIFGIPMLFFSRMGTIILIGLGLGMARPTKTIYVCPDCKNPR